MNPSGLLEAIDHLRACQRKFVVRLRFKVGDVFVTPLGDGRAGVGQVVGTFGKVSYCFAVFDLVLPLGEAKKRAAQAL